MRKCLLELRTKRIRHIIISSAVRCVYKSTYDWWCFPEHFRRHFFSLFAEFCHCLSIWSWTATLAGHFRSLCESEVKRSEVCVLCMCSALLWAWHIFFCLFLRSIAITFTNDYNRCVSFSVFYFAELPKKCMLAVCREWSSSGDSDKIVLDRTRRDRLKKLKTLLRTCLPAEQYAEITWV